MPKPIATTDSINRAPPVPGASPRRWLMLVHQLPPLPSNLRVRTWRRLQELGAVAVKQSVYVLPDNAESREDFEWLKVEIEGAGGEATVYSAEHVEVAAEAALIDQFRRVRQQAYAELASELQRMRRAGASRQRSSGRRPRSRALSRAVGRHRARRFFRQRRTRPRGDVAWRAGSDGSVDRRRSSDSQAQRQSSEVDRRLGAGCGLPAPAAYLARLRLNTPVYAALV